MRWSSLPRTGGRTSLPVVRLKANETYQGIILSDDALGCEIHYMGKSVPCTDPKDECPGCNKGLGVRWEGYVGVFNPLSHSISILPLTSVDRDQLEVYRQAHNTLRGCTIIKKRGRTSNARCTLDLRRSLAPVNSLPEDADVIDTLSHMWGLKDSYVSHIIEQLAEQRVLPKSGQAEASVDTPQLHHPLDDEAAFNAERNRQLDALDRAERKAVRA